ncbi:hypothetical protein B5E65_12235 [Gemmiger sp. An120]|uniref:sigma factor-like helix-turn-helix DNA-binding protein n=1 Tax=Gemmiger sp. An120 TaxID=1965549 RepID=UPI000B39F658|nr:sigma-70 region 4 domain-containing protein [Gemmiger sp. An120]OUQ41397.1 hypothetical protein B5E65_12235 [Gemmiger sp. An120]
MAKTDFTPEQISEIQAAYRDAANPKKQISILADLYATTKEEICKVLEIEMPAPKPKKVPRSYDQSVKDSVVKAVILDGMTYQQAAERFGVPYGNVNAWVNKARKKQAEFSRFAEEVEAEQTAAPAAAPENKVKKTANSGSSKKPPAPSPAERKPLYERVLREVNDGVDGFDTFLSGFIGIDIFNESEEDMLDNLSERIHGFRDGLKTGIELMKEEAKSNARDS